MWYVIQTMTGHEQEVVDAIETILSEKQVRTYERCFVLYRECLWRMEGKLRLHTETLFPSYIFVETQQPEDFFFALKRVPKLSKLLGADGTFWNIHGEEERFLRKMMAAGEEREACGRYLVRRSLVQVDDEGQIIAADGVLKDYLGQIVKQRLRKRSVIIEIPFLGKMRRVQLGIRLEGDAVEMER